MRHVLRFLFVAAFLASLYWISHAPSEPEPYISTILAVAALLGTFFEQHPSRVNIVPRFCQQRVTLKNGFEMNHEWVEVCNPGNEEVYDFELQIHLQPGSKRGPLLNAADDGGTRLTFPVVHAGQRFEVMALRGIDDPSEYTCAWRWRSPKGKIEIRHGVLRLETKNTQSGARSGVQMSEHD